ncbi:MAG TPA: hypothetical protein VGK97_12650 [Spongiibacteraceae bacterium]|jgi:hypothetical protein
MKSAIEKAKLGRNEELEAIRRLDEQARNLERQIIKGPTVKEIIDHEMEVSPQYGGRSVFGIEK